MSWDSRVLQYFYIFSVSLFTFVEVSCPHLFPSVGSTRGTTTAVDVGRNHIGSTHRGVGGVRGPRPYLLSTFPSFSTSSVGTDPEKGLGILEGKSVPYNF